MILEGPKGELFDLTDRTSRANLTHLINTYESDQPCTTKSSPSLTQSTPQPSPHSDPAQTKLSEPISSTSSLSVSQSILWLARHLRKVSNTPDELSTSRTNLLKIQLRRDFEHLSKAMVTFNAHRNQQNLLSAQLAHSNFISTLTLLELIAPFPSNSQTDEVGLNSHLRNLYQSLTL